LHRGWYAKNKCIFEDKDREVNNDRVICRNLVTILTVAHCKSGVGKILICYAKLVNNTVKKYFMLDIKKYELIV